MQRDFSLIVNSFHRFVRVGSFPSGFRIAGNSGGSRKAKERRLILPWAAEEEEFNYDVRQLEGGKR